MCRPPKTHAFTADEKPEGGADAPLTKTHTSNRSSSFVTKFSLFVAFITVIIPCLIGEIIGGWTKQYTSPLLFPTGDLIIPPQDNKVVIVTGANTGIGYETSLELVQAGAHVIVACRSESKAMKAMERIREELRVQQGNNTNTNEGQMTFLPLDLGSLKSVKAFAQQFQRLNIPLHTLILNAGVMKSPGAEFVGQQLTYGFDTTQDGLEYHIGVNHVAHFYLTQLLLDSFVTDKETKENGRIVVVSSMAEQGAYDTGMIFEDWVPTNGEMPSTYEDGRAYGQSKLANLLFAREFATRYAHKNIMAYSCHPGVIMTDLSRYMEPVLEADAKTRPLFVQHLSAIFAKLFESSMMASPAGALTQLHLATADFESLENGAFYHPVGRPVMPTHPQGSNATLQTLLWEETERVIQTLTK